MSKIATVRLGRRRRATLDDRRSVEVVVTAAGRELSRSSIMICGRVMCDDQRPIVVQIRKI